MYSQVDRKRSRGIVLAMSLVLVLTLYVVPGAAEEEQTKLPPAETILDDFVTAAGGLEAHEKIRNRVVKATFELVDAGVKGSLSIYAAKPNKMYTLVDAAELGRREAGTDGETVWEISTMTGPIIKEGPERSQTLKDATFDRIIYWRDNFESVETVGVEDVGDRSCYKVVQKPKNGDEETFYYDRETHLIAKMATTAQTQMGEVPVEAFPGEFKKVDGVLLPHFVTIKVLGQTRTVRTDSVEQNVELPKDRFDLPEDIRAMLE